MAHLAAVSAALASLALAAPAPVAPVAPAAPMAGLARHGLTEIPSTLEWRVEPAGADQPAGTVDFELGYRSEHHTEMMGSNIPLAALEGLAPASLAGDAEVRFTLKRDAGQFQCKGVARNGRGQGFCSYAPTAGFAEGLARRGIAGHPTALQQFELAMHDMGFAYVDELKRQRYATPDADGLILAAEHGVSLRQLKGFDAAGYRFGDVTTLVKVRDHGVSSRYVEALNSYGVGKQSAEALVKMRDHGVSATFIGELSQHGYVHLAADDLVRMRDHGVSSSFVIELEALGYKGLKPEILADLRDHGVGTGFIRRANDRSGGHMTPEELIRLHDRGGG